MPFRSGHRREGSSALARPVNREQRAHTSGEKPKEQKGVYILEKDGKVKFVEVTTGITGESDIEIVSGLGAGSEVITGPSRVLKTLKAGDKVKKQTRKPDAGASPGGGS